jgi:cytochrome c biogenesis protein CcmG/thiol:disulfide interchange protein DsbE
VFYRSIAFILLIFVAVCAVSCGQQILSTFQEGMAPDFTLKDMDGRTFRFADTRGNVVILDFWATWCPPCRMEIPHFEALYRQYGAKGLVIVGVALDRGGAANVKSFVEENGVTYTVVISDQRVISAYGGIRSIPTTFIIDREGRIVEKVVGYRDKEFFESRIKELL